MRTVVPDKMRVEVLSGFISHERKALAPGERVTLPRALALAPCHIGNARELTTDEVAAELQAAAAPTPPGVVEHREPDAQVRDPRTRKR
jgi:hypothetical protein